MRSAYLNALYDLAQKDANVVSLVADNGLIVYDKFKQDFPSRYFNFGIEEANMVAAAAGMSSCGLIPYCYTIGAFLAYRSYEFIRDDVCFQNLNVKIVGIGTGMTYSTLGPSHHSTEDIGLLRSIPNLTVFCPASRTETQWVMEESYRIKGPVYIRLGNNTEDYYEEDAKFELGVPSVVQDGDDITIVSTGAILSEVIKAANLLRDENINARVISIHTLKPLDKGRIFDTLVKGGKLVVVEEHNIIGGLYSAIAEILLEYGIAPPVLRIGLQDSFAKGYGSVEEVRAANGIGADAIYMKTERFFKEKV